MIRLAVRCEPAQAELVLAELVQLSPAGVEERSGPGWVEYAIYGAEGELPELGELEAVAGEGRLSVRSERMPDDWAERWREFHQPALVAGGRVVIRPSWRPRPDPWRGGLDVVIDPGQAFGTGAHPTTRMCVELMLDLADSGHARGALVDLGTGSGVLAIVAAKLGWEPVLGVDNADAALAAARENAGANGVYARFERGDLREGEPPGAPTALANLTAPLLRELAGRLPASVERLVCSGLLAGERDDVARAFGRAGLLVRDERREGDWAALLLERR